VSRSCLPVAIFALFTALTACGGSEASNDEIGSADSNLTPARIGTVASVHLPITEVSGLGHRIVGNKTTYLAVGDASTTLVTFTIGSSGRISNVDTHDLSALFGSSASQWEGVAGDGEGRVFLLTESESTITVLDKDLRRILHKIKLSIPRNHPLAADWADDENSRGEGMVLLANGHIIVAKEKNPPALVEFAPRNAAPEGYRADLALGTRAFPLPQGATTEFVATKHWVLKDRDAGWLSDISDLAIDQENRLLLLSDQGRAIARIERTLDPIEAKIDVKAIFSLPSGVDKPEGLAFGGSEPFVATDSKHADDDALFEIEALPDDR
jgi:uncharacterized protein YjiK